MADSGQSDQGIFEHLYKRQTFFWACTSFGLLLLLFLILRWQHSLPNYGFIGAFVSFVEDVCVHLSAILAAFIISYIFLSDDQVLTSSEIGRILDKIRETIHGAISFPSVDDLLLSKTGNGQVLELAGREAWILRETGQTVFSDSLQPLINILNDEGCLKIILAHPNSIGAEEIGFRKATGKSQFESRSQTTKSRLTKLYASVPDARRRVEVRYSGFSLPATSIIVNPRAVTDASKSLGRAEILYTFPSHMGEDRDRMSLRLDSQNSPRAAKVICAEFLRVFQCSSKVVLIRSVPGFPIELGIKIMFPGFIERGEPPSRVPSGMKGLSQVESAEDVFIISFDIDPQDQTKPYRVHYGPADRPARSVNYARPTEKGEEGKWIVRAEHVIGLQKDLAQAIGLGHIIFVTNIGAIALGLPSACDKTYVSEVDIASSPSTDRAFFKQHQDASNGRMPISIAERLLPILEDRKSHLFLHFQDFDPARGTGFYERVIAHERCTVLPETGFSELLLREVDGSVMAIKHARGWFGRAGATSPSAAEDRQL